MTISRRAMLAALAAGCATEPPMPTLNVFELRNYEMRPGGRDVLIEMFEAHFLESQEALGAIVIGTFRNLDDPNRFVWMRGFADMEARFAALDGFYTSPIWRAYREAANATIIDSDNVLLLRPVAADAFTQPGALPPVGRSDIIIVARTYALTPQNEAAFAAQFSGEAAPRLAELDAVPFTTFATEHAPNSYPRLPIRENDTVFVTLTRFANVAAYDAKREAIAALDARVLANVPDIMRLAPTACSRLR